MASPSTENLPGPPAANQNEPADHPAYQNDSPPAPQNEDDPNNAPDKKNQTDKSGGGKGKFWWVVAGVVVLCVVLIVVGIVPRVRAKPKLQTQTKEQNQSGTPEVPITYPKRGPTQTTIQLPGNMEAVQESDISARTSGYVRRWLVDLGDNVREGQVLAEIDAPEVNQQEAQARAQLIQAQAGVIQQRAEEARAVASLAQSRQNAERQRAQLTQARARFPNRPPMKSRPPTTTTWRTWRVWRRRCGQVQATSPPFKQVCVRRRQMWARRRRRQKQVKPTLRGSPFCEALKKCGHRLRA